MVFLSQKVDENIFTGYWKVLVLAFSEMGNTVFSWAKTLTEIWYLLITEKFLFYRFRKWEIQPFLEPKSWQKYDVYWLLESSCCELVGDWKYGLFFESRSWWKDDIYWLLRSSCFEHFSDGKYRIFSAKTLMERWYLRGLFELSRIFQDLGKMAFRSVAGLKACNFIKRDPNTATQVFSWEYCKMF